MTLIKPVTLVKRLSGRNLLYANTEYFDAKTVETSSTKRYMRTRTLLKHFWNRWRQEYVTELQEFNRIKNHRGNLVKANINGDV